MMIVFIVHIFVPIIQCEESHVNSIKKYVHESIQTHQLSQKELDEWEKERLTLKKQYEMLTKQNDLLTDKSKHLKIQVDSQNALNEKLTRLEKESLRISKEIGPFIDDLNNQMNTFIASDLPFLIDERKNRLSRLNSVLEDSEVSIAEKFRKIMEVLFIEAEYGNTIEVYQDKILFNKENVLGNIFRLGRISLFFLSLDQKNAAYFNVGSKKWTALDPYFIPEIQAAIEIGKKRRPVELLCLPLGKLASQ